MMHSILDKEGGFRFDLTETECREDLTTQESISRQNNIDPELNVYPNPSSGKVFLDITNLEKPDRGTLQIFDFQGNLIIKKEIFDIRQTFEIDLRDKSNQSIFIIELITEKGLKFSKKVVIQ